MNCHACGTPLAGQPTVRLEFAGFESFAMNGLAFTCCASCVEVKVPPSDVLLASRIEEGADDLVVVEQWGADYLAICHEHGKVAEQDTEADAKLHAAGHIGRVHVGVPV